MLKYGMYLLLFIIATGCDQHNNKRSTAQELDDIRPVVEDGAYADYLANCARASEPHMSCRFSALPPIAVVAPTPSIDDIMDRVAVSHTWMGTRFRQLLEHMPEDLLTMFGAVTVVVIDADIRPSYYWSLTGAIYLDPANLWLTAYELATISTKTDYRAAYADPMNFRSYWRLTIDGGDIPRGFSDARDMEHIVIPMASLLFHELAHANDLLPPQRYADVNMSKSIYEVSEDLQDHYPSNQFDHENQEAQFPLGSDVMRALAGILYRGESPSNPYLEMTATEVGSHFAPDNASDDYAYTSQYEDFAMLIEEAMLKIHFDVDRDIAFINPPGDNAQCNDYIIGWGVRNRLGEQRILDRAQFALEAVWPERDFSSDLANFPEATPLPANSTWYNCSNSPTAYGRAEKLRSYDIYY